ncbi:hypothetical protein [Dictyobacter aurantiacus]|uniref:Uncharacterized protein n=1 Tax=Dictyobacter aurantiacus TaxID=1936993 RepID=A0A401ZNJ4_9CHLR|nr:hypothetical protein [Dictyobacter aurantiacus]GCE08457.1 hypothetical protein KDAU_57860 [Dictyobacter aurantiacus]
MSTRDLGKHVVELHEEGMLAITGEGTRLMLSPHEAIDFLNWLNQHKKTLEVAVRAHPTTGAPELLQEETTEPITDDDPEYPVDEP